MTIATSTLSNSTISNVSTWSSSNVSTNNAFQITCDIDITAAANSGTITVYRVAPTSILELLFQVPFSAPGKYSFDLGHFDLIDGTTPNLYACAFGSTINIQIDSSGLFSGTCSLKGKGTI